MKSQRSQFQSAYVEQINASKPMYHLTVTFLKGTYDDVAENSIRFLFRLINKKLYGNRFYNKNKYIKGFIVRERCKSGTLHYHTALIDPDGDLPSRDDIFNAIRSSVPKVTWKNDSSRRIIASEGWQLQDYYDTGDKGLEYYITKNFNKWEYTLEQATDSIGKLEMQGINFGSDMIPRSEWM